MGYNRSGTRRKNRLKRHKRYMQHLAEKAARQQEETTPEKEGLGHKIKDMAEGAIHKVGEAIAGVAEKIKDAIH
jgi:predicted Holliday junction resolvase-like endonuclease